MNNNCVDKNLGEKVLFQVDDSKLCVLFGSKTRVKLLRIFLSNPEDAYFVRELTRLTDSQINAIRRELSNLINIGIIKLDKGRNEQNALENLKKGLVMRKSIGGVEKKYYALNKNFVLHKELNNFFKKLFVLSKEAFVDRLNELGEIDYLLLTGVFTGEEDSPVDILIVGDVDKEKLEKLIADLGAGIGKDLNFTYLTSKEYLYRREIVDKFLYNIIESKNKVVLVDRIDEELNKKSK